MSRALFIIRDIFLILFLLTVIPFSNIHASADKGDPIIITSQTLTADNKNNTAVFEGYVVAKTGDIFIYSDRMEVAYDNAKGMIREIRALGGVKVQRKKRAIFSEEAIYFGREEKIVFNGEPKAVDGENVITGTQIIYFFRDDRTVVKGSRVILKNERE
jgi:lipopolysaccharide export system protein LptA